MPPGCKLSIFPLAPGGCSDGRVVADGGDVSLANGALILSAAPGSLLYPPGAEERVKKIYGEFGSVDVPTITLNELLDANDVESIDFLSMDIEQGEPAALAGFDIERFRPELVCIEANLNVRERISAYFEEHGYERIDAYLKHDPVNWYFTPKKEPSVKPAKN